MLTAFDPAIPQLAIYPREIKKCAQANMHMNIHSSVTYKIPKVQTIQMSINQ